MERLNWAVLGLIGIVTALGLGTSSGAGKTKTELAEIERNFQKATEITTVTVSGMHPKRALQEDVAKLVATSSAPACSACQNHASSTQVVTVTPNSTTDQPCPGNCQATGVCCDKSLPKTETAVATAKTEMHACEGECCLSKKATATAGVTVSTDCPLTKAADAIASLTKNYVCEGGECLTKPGQFERAIAAADPTEIELTAKPEGLSNLLAAAEAVKTEQPAVDVPVPDITKDEITIATEPTLTTAEGLKAIEDLVKNKKAPTTTQSSEKVDTKTAEPKKIDAKPAIDNSRAAARAVKLAKLEEKMAQPWTLAFNETPLTQAVATVQEKYGVPVLLDRKALDEAGIDLATPLTADQQPEIEAGELLRGYLRNHNLTWMIPSSNDRILITTVQAMEAMPINRVFDVTDLIDENHGAEGIVERIQSLVEPTTWKANGGQGDLTVWQKGNRVSLVCSNTYWTQRAIVELLEDLRSIQQSDEILAPGKVDDLSSVMRRYDLPGTAHTEDAAEQQKIIQQQRDFLLSLCKDIEGFDPTTFQVAIYGTEMLVTKQTPAVHRKLQQTLKLVSPAYPCGGGFGGTTTDGVFGN